MRRHSRRTWFATVSLVGAIALAGAACGGDDGDDEAVGEQTEEATDEVEAPEGRDDQDPGFDDLTGADDLDLRDVDDDDRTDDERTDDERTDDERTDDERDVDEYEDYTFLEDDSGTLTLSVPEEWDDVELDAPLGDGDGNPLPGAGILASSDLDDMFDYRVPGMSIAVTADTVAQSPDALREANADAFATDCVPESEDNEYDDGFYVGAFDLYTDCSSRGAAVVVLAATSPDDGYIVSLVGIVFTEADLFALDEIVVSSFYTGTG